MRCVNLREEKKLWKKGYQNVAGLDEVGRGPLSGPVVAAATTLTNFRKLNFRNLAVNDSKKLTPLKRKTLYKILTNNFCIEWGIGRVSEKVIDKINILEATKVAMKKAVKNLEKKLSSTSKRQKYHISYDRRNRSIINFLILDGNFNINLPIPQKSIIKADEKVFSCQVASIVAKVHRDRIMERYHKLYPQYGFDKHKGYPTKHHTRMLKKYGPCKIHRKTFKPVANFKNLKI